VFPERQPGTTESVPGATAGDDRECSRSDSRGAGISHLVSIAGRTVPVRRGGSKDYGPFGRTRSVRYFDPGEFG
jgi:hypothetical protein